MSKIIAICSDGTANTFGMPDEDHSTNVSHLVHQLLLDEPEHQLVFDGQGVGSV